MSDDDDKYARAALKAIVGRLGETGQLANVMQGMSRDEVKTVTEEYHKAVEEHENRGWQRRLKNPGGIF